MRDLNIGFRSERSLKDGSEINGFTSLNTGGRSMMFCSFNIVEREIRAKRIRMSFSELSHF
jgi:hypothetical protein